MKITLNSTKNKQKTQKISFPKEQVNNATFHKPVLNKTMTVRIMRKIQFLSELTIVYRKTVMVKLMEWQ